MCFNIDVTIHHTLTLILYYNRITSLLDSRAVVAALPDHGTKLRYVRRNLIREINFRDDLDATRNRVLREAVKCASDTQLLNAMGVRRCSVSRRLPEHRRVGHQSNDPRLQPRATQSAPMESLRGFPALPMHADVRVERSIRRRSRRLAAQERRKNRARAKRTEVRSVTSQLALAFRGAVGIDLENLVIQYVLTGNIEGNQEEPQPGPSGLQRIQRAPRNSNENLADSDDDIEVVLPALPPPGRRFKRFGGDEEDGFPYF